MDFRNLHKKQQKLAALPHNQSNSLYEQPPAEVAWVLNKNWHMSRGMFVS